MTDTPRMNAALTDSLHNYSGDVLRIGRQIELELNAANERIKQLQEAGDSMYQYAFNVSGTRWLVCMGEWRKAKGEEQ